MFKIIWVTTSFPLQLTFEASVCQNGAVEVFMLFPMPAMIRPAIVTGTLDIYNIAPTVTMIVPMRMVFFHPSKSPTITAIMAPRKQPMSYTAVTVPIMEMFPLSFRVSRKSYVTMTPHLRTSAAVLGKGVGERTKDSLILSEQCHINCASNSHPECQPASCQPEVWSHIEISITKETKSRNGREGMESIPLT